MDALKALQAAVATQSGMSGICAASPAIRAADFCSCSAALHHLSCCRTGRWLHADHCALTHHSCFEVSPNRSHIAAVWKCHSPL